MKNRKTNESTVKIGNQEWMTNNLNVATFKNGDAIPEAQTSEAWIKAGEEGRPAWCYYDNDPENGNKYGRLYNWYAVTDLRGLAPSGWHIPSDAEWTTLVDYFGAEGGTGRKMKSQAGWEYEGNGSNASGFSGLPGGYRADYGTFGYIGYFGGWWSSTEYWTNAAWLRNLTFDNGGVDRASFFKTYGWSVRCLRD